jgi:dynein heavy chain
MDIIRLWLHEASRVYGDKLIDTKDMETFKQMKFDMAKAGFEVSIIRVTLKHSVANWAV